MHYLCFIYGVSMDLRWCGDVVMVMWCDDVVMWWWMWWCGNLKWGNEKLITSDFDKKRTENVGSWFSNISFDIPPTKGSYFLKILFCKRGLNCIFSERITSSRGSFQSIFKPDHSKGHRLLILYCKIVTFISKKMAVSESTEKWVRNRAEHKTAKPFSAESSTPNHFPNVGESGAIDGDIPYLPSRQMIPVLPGHAPFLQMHTGNAIGWFRDIILHEITVHPVKSSNFFSLYFQK